MKIIFLIQLLIVLTGTQLFAQIPQGIQYQAVVRDETGNPLPNTSLRFRITIEKNDGSEMYYQETHALSSNALGGINLVIGQGTVQSGIFTNINWKTGAIRTRVEMDPSGGQNYQPFGTTTLQSVPFALFADNAGSLIDANGNEWIPEDDRDEQILTVNGNQLAISNGNIVTLPTGSGGDNWGTQTIETEPELSGNGTLSAPLTIARQGASNGDVLKWNGNSWTPQEDNGLQYIAGDGISINGDVINNTGDDDNDPNNEIQTLSINGNTLSLTEGGNVNLPIVNYTEGTGINIAGSTISAENTQAIWNANFLQNRNVSPASPSTGQVLKWDGGTWTPGTDNGQNYAAGTGINLTGNTISAQNTTALWNANQLRGFNVMTNTPVAGNYLQYSASGWIPANGPAQPWTQSGNNIYYSTGNVGFGVSNPMERLHVFDEDKIRMDDQTFGKWATVSIEFSSNVVPLDDDSRDLGTTLRRWNEVWATDGTINTSDMRDKTNIQSIAYGLDDIMKLRPVSFNWKKRPERGTKLGLIAQELEMVIPEVVANPERIPSVNSEPGEAGDIRLGVYYSDLIPVLIKAIQEQEAKIRQLQEEVAILKKG